MAGADGRIRMSFKPIMRAHTALARSALLAIACLAVGCGEGRPAASPSGADRDVHAPGARSAPPPSGPLRGEPDEVGLASWYGRAFAGKKTASGERFDPKLFTAAHKKLPFGTWVEVRRIDNGRTVRVRITDRGPNGRAAHRIIDLSQRAAEALDMLGAGVVRVEVRVLPSSTR